MTIDLIPVQAPAPIDPLPVVASTTHVGRIVTDWVVGLTRDNRLAEPDSIRVYPDRAFIDFSDHTALTTAVAWAEQLDAGSDVDVVLDVFGAGDTARSSVSLIGRVCGIEVWLHVSTRAQLTAHPDLAELRRRGDADRACRAIDEDLAEAGQEPDEQLVDDQDGDVELTDEVADGGEQA